MKENYQQYQIKITSLEEFKEVFFKLIKAGYIFSHTGNRYKTYEEVLKIYNTETQLKSIIKQYSPVAFIKQYSPVAFTMNAQNNCSAEFILGFPSDLPFIKADDFLTLNI